MTATPHGRPGKVSRGLAWIGLVASTALVITACGAGAPSSSSLDSLLPHPTTIDPSPSATPGQIYFDDGTVVTSNAIGILHLGDTLTDIGPGVVVQDCGSLSRMPINIYANLDESGRIIVLSAVTDDLYYDPLGDHNIAWDLETDRGLSWGASVDDVLTAYGPGAYFEHGVVPDGKGGRLVEPRVVVPPPDEGEGAMVFVFGRFEETPAPEAYGPLLEIRLTVPGAENHLRPCA